MIWIDGHYDMVATQERLKCGRTSGVDFGPVDYVKYAEAFGATAFQIQSADQIAPTLKKLSTRRDRCSSACTSITGTMVACLKTFTKKASTSCQQFVATR